MSIVVSDRLFVGVVGQTSLHGVVGGVCSLVATLLASGAMVGAIATQSTATATLSSASGGVMVGVISVTSTINGLLVGGGVMVGAIPGQSIITGTIGSGSVVGVIPATSSLTGSLLGTGILVGVENGVTVLSGMLLGVGAMVGTVTSTSAFGATPSGSSAIVGTINSNAILQGILTGGDMELQRFESTSDIVVTTTQGALSGPLIGPIVVGGRPIEIEFWADSMQHTVITTQFIFMNLHYGTSSGFTVDFSATGSDNTIGSGMKDIQGTTGFARNDFHMKIIIDTNKLAAGTYYFKLSGFTQTGNISMKGGNPPTVHGDYSPITFRAVEQ